MRKLVLALVALATLALTACGSGDSSQAPSERTLTVFAAASLTDSFTELGKKFETDNPGVKVRVNFGSSSDLAQQIANGAQADVFAAASPATMKTVTDKGLGDGVPVTFVSNELQIATAPGNPKTIRSFADLAKPDLKVVLCAPQVPCGAAALAAQKAAGVTIKPVSEEADVKSTLAKVTSGNADAAVVYVTDVIAANKTKATVDGVRFPEAKKVINDYPIVVIRNAAQAGLALRFIDLVRSDAGRSVLSAAGFVVAST